MIKSLLNAKTPFGGGRPLMTLAAVSLLMLLLAPVATAQDIRYGDSFSATLARRGSGRDVNREFEFYGRDGDEIRVDVTSSGGGVQPSQGLRYARRERRRDATCREDNRLAQQFLQQQ